MQPNRSVECGDNAPQSTSKQPDTEDLNNLASSELNANPLREQLILYKISTAQ